MTVEYKSLIGEEKFEVLGKYLSQCHTGHQKFHMYFRGIEPVPL
jgi:hypothetical protein